MAKKENKGVLATPDEQEHLEKLRARAKNWLENRKQPGDLKSKT
jgi:hypothetical protein